MALSVTHAVKEAGGNLWRNAHYALAAVLTVMVSMALVGSALLLRQGVENFTQDWAHGVNIKVWMNPEATKTEVGSVGTMLDGSPFISRSCDYVDKTQSYALLHRVFAGQPDILNAFPTQQTVPTIYECVLTNPSDGNAVGNLVQRQAGVYAVQVPAQGIRIMESVTSILQVVLLGLSILMLVASGILIFLTIRMAIFSRRREVAVMKLVGATNWYIRIPFMLEGFIEGVLGALVAGGLVFVIRSLLNDVIRNLSRLGSSGPSFIQASVATSHDALMTGVLLLVVGAMVGAVGSFVAVRRFLDV